jgi:DNA-binding NarL/FixJ family response regulator
MTRVLIVGDHAFSRHCLVALVSSTPDLEVVGECGSAVRPAELHELGAHVVVMDVRASDLASDLAGVHGGGRQQNRPTARVLMLTGDTSAGTLARIRARGAAGCVIKGSNPAVVLTAIRRVAFGGAWPEDPAGLVAAGR